MSPCAGDMNALKMYHVEEIQAFLMDPEKCPTTWGELIHARGAA